jgi:general stress protein YciG
MSNSIESKPEAPKRRPLGLETADAETRSAIARIGGKTIGKNSEHMIAIGRKGGLTTAQDKAHMAEIGRKGGKAKRRCKDGAE